jgi:hypothetical protein
MFVPTVATKPVGPPSQPQQRNIYSFGNFSQRLPDGTLPVGSRVSASFPKQHVVDARTPAEAANPVASQPIFKKKRNMDERIVVTFSFGRMVGETARIETERALLFDDTAHFDYVRVVFGVERCHGPDGSDVRPFSKRGKDLGKVKYIKLTDDEELLAAQIFDQCSAKGASDNASIKALRKLTRFSNVTVCSIKKWRTNLRLSAERESPAVVNNKKRGRPALCPPEARELVKAAVRVAFILTALHQNMVCTEVGVLGCA